MASPGPGRADRGLDELLLAVHGALTVGEVQRAFLRHAPAVLPAQAHGIYHLETPCRPVEAIAAGVSDEFLAAYEDVGRAVDPLLARLSADLEPVSSDLGWSAGDWRAQPFYEVLGVGGIHHVMQSPLVVDGRLVGTLNVAAPRPARRFGERELATLRLVARHVSVAYARALRARELEARATAAEALLDLLDLPLLVHTSEGDVLFANRAAERLLSGPGSAAVAATVRAGLRANAWELARGGRRVVTSSLRLHAPARAEGWEPPRARPAGGPAGVSVRSALLASDGSALVSFAYALPAATALPLPILSPREQEIVDLVVRGLTNRQIAAAASISPNTVKQHLKRVFGKLDVHSRAELAAAAARGGEPLP